MNRDRLKSQLTRDEGIRESVYQDSEGYYTVGIGRMLDARRGGKLSRDEIELLLDNDIDRVTYRLGREYSWFSDLSDVRQEAMINMAFNLGLQGFGKFRNMIAAIERTDWIDAAREILDSRYARQVGDRAIRISEAMRTGQWKFEA